MTVQTGGLRWSNMNDHVCSEIKWPNCKVIKKTWRVAGGSKKIIADFSSENSECALGRFVDIAGVRMLDDANLRQAWKFCT